MTLRADTCLLAGGIPRATSSREDGRDVGDGEARHEAHCPRVHIAKVAYLGEVLMENRHGLQLDACVVPATGTMNVRPCRV